MSDILDDVKEFAALTTSKQALQSALKEVQGQLDTLGEQLVDAFTQRGVQNMTVDGKMAYLHVQQWASARDGDYARAIQALQNSGMDEMIRPATQGVNAYFRSLNSPEEAGPEMCEAFEIDERAQIRVRSAS